MNVILRDQLLLTDTKWLGDERRDCTRTTTIPERIVNHTMLRVRGLVFDHRLRCSFFEDVLRDWRGRLVVDRDDVRIDKHDVAGVD